MPSPCIGTSYSHGPLYTAYRYCAPARAMSFGFSMPANSAASYSRTRGPLVDT